MNDDYPLTIKGLREALEGLADDAPVRVAVLTVRDTATASWTYNLTSVGGESVKRDGRRCRLYACLRYRRTVSVQVPHSSAIFATV